MEPSTTKQRGLSIYNRFFVSFHRPSLLPICLLADVVLVDYGDDPVSTVLVLDTVNLLGPMLWFDATLATTSTVLLRVEIYMAPHTCQHFVSCGVHDTLQVGLARLLSILVGCHTGHSKRSQEQSLCASRPWRPIHVKIL